MTFSPHNQSSTARARTKLPWEFLEMGPLGHWKVVHVPHSVTPLPSLRTPRRLLCVHFDAFLNATYRTFAKVENRESWRWNGKEGWRKKV